MAAPSWSWASIEGTVSPAYLSDEIVPSATIISYDIQPVAQDVFGQLRGGELVIECVLFEMPQFKDFYNRLNWSWGDGWDGYSLSFDDRNAIVQDAQAWFLPVGNCDTISPYPELTLCGIIIQEVPEHKKQPAFRRIGFAVVSDEGEIAQTGWRCAKWKRRTWTRSLFRRIVLV